MKMKRNPDRSKPTPATRDSLRAVRGGINPQPEPPGEAINLPIHYLIPVIQYR